MKLNEISAKTDLTTPVIETIIKNAPVLNVLEFYPIVGNASNTRKSSSATGGAFRPAGTDFSANAQSPAYETPTLTIFGEKSQVDRAYERRGLDIPSARAMELLGTARAIGRKFQEKFFLAASTTANEFDGLNAIVPSGQVITAAANGLSVTLGNTDAAKKAQQQFLELLDELITKVSNGATALFMNSKVISRLSSIARDQIKMEKTEFGTLLPYYNGIPLISAGFTLAGAAILPSNIAVGTSGTKCTNIYAIRSEEAAELSLATNVGLEIKDNGMVGSLYEYSVEMDVDLALLNDTAVAKLEGIIVE